jgi:hypothetical protein
VDNALPVQGYGQTGDPTTTQSADGNNPPVLTGRNGDALVSDTHGKWYNAGARGKTFLASNSGVIGLHGTITSLTGLALWNPIGSGKNLELVSLRIGNGAQTTPVAADILLTFYIGVGAGVWALPTSVVAPTYVMANPIGGANAGVPVAKAIATCTMGAAGTTFVYAGISIGSTTVINGEFSDQILYDGEIIIAPGVLVSLQGTSAQTQASLNSFSWAEWPI